MKLLLDTHVLIWWFEPAGKLSSAQRKALTKISPEHPCLIADITLWEIAMLHQLGRIRLSMPLRDWMERATAAPLAELCPITPAVAAEVAALPESFHSDPADRILVATARVLGATMVTSDRNIASSGLVPVIG